MAFVWPNGVQNKTKRLVSQILWTLHLDFEGALQDSKDAPLELAQAMEGHGVEIPNLMNFRMIFPHLDGGKYGRIVDRTVEGRRTRGLAIACPELPEDSHLPDGAGGIGHDDRIDLQLFGAASPTNPARRNSRDLLVASPPDPARGDTRDLLETTDPTRGVARDENLPTRRNSRDEVSATPAPGLTGDGDLIPAPARGVARDDECIEPVSGSAGNDDVKPVPGTTGNELPLLTTAPGSAGDTDDNVTAVERTTYLDEVDIELRGLDSELAELSGPIVVGDQAPQALLDTIVGLMGELEQLVTSVPASTTPDGRSEAEWAELLHEKHHLTESIARLMRRVRDAEARLIDRKKETESLQLQLQVLNTRYTRLEQNNDALLRGEHASGQHLRQVQKFISETPSDRPDRGRSRPNRPNGRTTGSDSTLAYTVG